jgi:23S rRNA-/tRNA-specific pseudouridylate synthase
VAIVEGKISLKNGTWSYYLQQTKGFKMKATSAEFGKLATSHFTTLSSKKDFSALKIRLDTGRKNQIRISAQMSGHPIVGDQKYGAVSNPLNRLGLHAETLGFIHPITGKKLFFHSPIPISFLRFMR